VSAAHALFNAPHVCCNSLLSASAGLLV
jgi:hypothetical protein